MSKCVLISKPCLNTKRSRVPHLTHSFNKVHVFYVCDLLLFLFVYLLLVAAACKALHLTVWGLTRRNHPVENRSPNVDEYRYDLFWMAIL